MRLTPFGESNCLKSCTDRNSNQYKTHSPDTTGLIYDQVFGCLVAQLNLEIKLKMYHAIDNNGLDDVVVVDSEIGNVGKWYWKHENT